MDFKKAGLLGGILLLIVSALIWKKTKTPPNTPIQEITTTILSGAPTPVPMADLEKILDKPAATSQRTLDIPTPLPEESPVKPKPLVPPSMPSVRRGLVLWDDPLSGLRTGDLIPVDESTTNPKIQVLTPEQADVFINETIPMTLGTDPSFSMLDFYHRAMANPDPEIHKIIAGRLIYLISLHDEYSSTWTGILRDRDPGIRSLAIATLAKRGLGRSRLIVDDLIQRLTELTKTRATGEKEAEVLAIIDLLKDSGHTRAQSALASFAESWQGKQSEAVLKALQP